MKLSKTNFLVWRDCPHNAWVKVHEPEVYKAKPISAFDRNIIDAGNEVDELARGLFPGGITIARGDAAGTAGLIARHAPVLYQPVFETQRFTTAADIMAWNAATSSYDLYEVKASTNGGNIKANDELYTCDIAFQAEVLRQNGVPLGRLHLVRLDSTYVRGESLDIGRLFTREDFTDRATAIRDTIAAEMDTAHEFLSEPTLPTGPCGCMFKGRSSHCTSFARINPGVPAYSVHDITRIGNSRRKLAALVEAGALRPEDVPAGFALTEPQENQVRAAKSRQPLIRNSEISAFLDALRYPLSFLDYETYPAAVPRYSGYGPFDHIPFQFSLDIIEAPGGDLRHFEHLDTSGGNPDLGLLEALAAALPPRGSIIVWNDTFERGINDKLAERNAGYRDWLLDIDVRVADLMEVFTTQAYVHPGFRGKTSIKSVLPVLAPQFTYKALAIQEGGTATTRWNEIVTGVVDRETAETYRSDLLAYCGLDTRAMVEIWRALTAEVAEARAAV